MSKKHLRKHHQLFGLPLCWNGVDQGGNYTVVDDPEDATCLACLEIHYNGVKKV